MPRSFWFVQIRPSRLGINPAVPPLVTDPRAIAEAKKPYQDVRMEGVVESEFLYATLLSTDLVPFGHLEYRPVVLPLEKDGDHYRMIKAEEARSRGFLHLGTWLNAVENEWQTRRTTKAANSTSLDWLNWQSKLARQRAEVQYRVVYAMSGSYMCASVIQSNNLEFDAGEQHIPAQGFITDYKSFFYETDDRQEAYYLAAVLNSPIVDEQLKPMQTRGLFGPRDICKKVLELPIPAFKADISEHQQLAALAEQCSVQVAHWIGNNAELAKQHNTPSRIGKLRTMIRNVLASELQAIDGLVRPLLE